MKRVINRRYSQHINEDFSALRDRAAVKLGVYNRGLMDYKHGEGGHQTTAERGEFGISVSG